MANTGFLTKFNSIKAGKQSYTNVVRQPYHRWIARPPTDAPYKLCKYKPPTPHVIKYKNFASFRTPCYVTESIILPALYKKMFRIWMVRKINIPI